ncbi:MAG: J domain-containing protein [Cyclobacteriaceae bacterium]
MEKYYHILGIHVSAGKAEIKQAYRQLAKKYHPDRNSSQDAAQMFIRITEAYEILIGERPLPRPVQSMRRHTSFRERKAAYNFRARSYRHMWEEEQLRRRREARKAARDQARKQYENFRQNNAAFKKSWYYKPAFYLVKAVVLAGWCVGLLLILSPLISTYFFVDHGSQWWKGFFCLPLVLAGIICIRQTSRLKQEAAPYFR